MIIANLNSFSANLAVALKIREDVLPTAESIEILDFRWISSNAEDSQGVSIFVDAVVGSEGIDSIALLSGESTLALFSECILSVKDYDFVADPMCIEPG
jgi:hypothetical protein